MNEDKMRGGLLSEYERDINVKSSPVVKAEGSMEVKTEDISSEMLKSYMLRPYSLHITDFSTEETVSLVGDNPRELVMGLAEIWQEYSIEFCIGTIWRNDTGEIVGRLDGDVGEGNGVWRIDGAELIEPSDEDEEIDAPSDFA